MFSQALKNSFPRMSPAQGDGLGAGGGVPKPEPIFACVQYFKLGKVLGTLLEPLAENNVRILRYCSGISRANAVLSQELGRFAQDKDQYPPFIKATTLNIAGVIESLPECIARPYKLKDNLRPYIDRIDPDYFTDPISSTDAFEFCKDLTRICNKADLLKQIAGNDFIRNPTEGFFGRLRDYLDTSLLSDAGEWAKLCSHPGIRKRMEKLIDQAVKDYADSLFQYYRLSMTCSMQITRVDLQVAALDKSQNGNYQISHVDMLDDPTRQFFLDIDLKEAVAFDAAVRDLSAFKEDWLAEFSKFSLREKLSLFRREAEGNWQKGGRSPQAFNIEFFTRTHNYMQELGKIDDYLSQRLQ